MRRIGAVNHLRQQPGHDVRQHDRIAPGFTANHPGTRRRTTTAVGLRATGTLTPAKPRVSSTTRRIPLALTLALAIKNTLRTRTTLLMVRVVDIRTETPPAVAAARELFRHSLRLPNTSRLPLPKVPFRDSRGEEDAKKTEEQLYFTEVDKKIHQENHEEYAPAPPSQAPGQPVTTSGTLTLGEYGTL